MTNRSCPGLEGREEDVRAPLAPEVGCKTPGEEHIDYKNLFNDGAFSTHLNFRWCDLCDLSMTLNCN